MIQIKQKSSKCYSRGAIGKIFFTFLLTFILMLPSTAFAAATPEPYVVLDGTTLTFYYDANKSDVSTGMVFDLHNYSWTEFPQWYFYSYTTVVLDQSMQNYHPTSTAFWFWLGYEITSIDLSYLNTDQITDMTAMFMGCSKMETFDLSNFNTANVTQAACMFQNCHKLKTIYVDSEKWDLSNLEDNSVLLFFDDPLLMGGAGTLWQPRDEYSTAEYARIDGGESAPGYLTSKTQTKPTVANITIKTLPTQLKYVPNEPLNIDKQAHMTVTLNNGRSFEQELSYANITGYTNDIGAQTLNVEFYGKSTTFNVTVEDKVAPYYYLSWYDTYNFVYDKYQEGYTYLCYDNIIKNDGSKEDIRFIIFEESFKNYHPTSCAYWFYDLINVRSFSGWENFNTDNATNMEYMFYGCRSITSLDLKYFNTSNVANMNYMFYDCPSLESIHVGSNWTTSAVTSSENMFKNCTSLKGGSGTTYDETKTDYTYAKIDGGTSSPGYLSNPAREPYAVLEGNTLTFYYDNNIPQNAYKFFTAGIQLWAWNQDITKAKFDPSFADYTPSSCSNLFYGLTNLSEIDGFQYLNTSEITDMSSMFFCCLNLTSLDLSSFDTRKVTNMSEMFDICVKLKTIYVGENFIVSSNTNTKDIFSGDYNLVGSKGTVYCMGNEDEFDGRYAHLDGGDNNPGFFSTKGQTPPAVTALSISTMPQTSFNKMETFNFADGILSVTFSGRKPQSLNFASAVVSGNYDSTTVGTYTKTVAYGGKSVTYNVKVEDNDALYCTLSSDNVLTLYYGKYKNNAKYFTQLKYTDKESATKVVIDKSLKSYTNLKSCKEWFSNCKNATEIEGLENIYTDNITDMYAMFDYCLKLKTLDLSSFNTAKVTNMNIMFQNCESLTTIFVGDSWSTKSLDRNITQYLFTNCKKLVGGSGTVFNSTKIDYTYAKVDGGTSSPGYFTLKKTNPYTKPSIKNNYYQISSTDELLWFMFDVNSGDVTANAVLTQDIVINQDCLNQITEMLNKTSKVAPALVEWRPIGDSNNAFMGIFDGQGHTISGLYIKDETLDNVGLFGNVGANAVIKNVGVVDSYISGNENVGAICGKSEGTVANCYSTSIVSGAKNVGGVVGVIEEEAVVCNSYNLGTVTSEDGQSAGVCNTASTNAVVENCYYLAETPVTNDPQAKTAEQFKSGEVAELLSQDVEINGVVYTNETVSANTEIPGMEEIEQRNNLTTSVAQVANEGNNIKVWSNNRTIYIETQPDTKYTVVDINGRLITTSTTKSTREEIQVTPKGVLLVIINNHSYKVLNQ